MQCRNSDFFTTVKVIKSRHFGGKFTTVVNAILGDFSATWKRLTQPPGMEEQKTDLIGTPSIGDIASGGKKLLNEWSPALQLALLPHFNCTRNALENMSMHFSSFCQSHFAFCQWRAKFY